MTLIIIIMILMIKIPQMIHLANCRKVCHLKKKAMNLKKEKALNQWSQKILILKNKNRNNLPLMKNQKKKKSRMNSNLKRNPLMKKNLLHLTLEEVVLFPPMKSPEEGVITAMKPHLNQRVMRIHLNQMMRENQVHHSLEDQQENIVLLLNMEVHMAINQPLKLKKK